MWRKALGVWDFRMYVKRIMENDRRVGMKDWSGCWIDLRVCGMD